MSFQQPNYFTDSNKSDVIVVSSNLIHERDSLGVGDVPTLDAEGLETWQSFDDLLGHREVEAVVGTDDKNELFDFDERVFVNELLEESRVKDVTDDGQGDVLDIEAVVEDVSEQVVGVPHVDHLDVEHS